MATPFTPPSPGDEEDSPPLTSSSFPNGAGMVLDQTRLASLLSKDNISWLIILALAGEVFGITDRVLALAAGAC